MERKSALSVSHFSSEWNDSNHSSPDKLPAEVEQVSPEEQMVKEDIDDVKNQSGI